MSLSMFRNMEKIRFFVFIFLIHHAAGYFQLTDEQFASMPPLIHADRFSHCVNRPGGLYCTTYANVVADQPNPLLHMMQNYTNAAARHYNYSKLLYGLCMTDTCKHHLKGNSSHELMLSAEACMNETFNRKYDLRVRVDKQNCYRYKERKHEKDYLDVIVGFVVGGVIALNVVATLYDLLFDKRDEEGLLLSFSFRNNWRRLVAPPNYDPRKTKLIGINGIRVITTIMVMLGHAPVPLFMSIENPQWLERAFDDAGMQVLFQGHIITQTFFVISGFLLTYNIQVLSETRKITLSMLPKGILLRWLRLTPVNIWMLMLTATWFKFSPYGPFWQEGIGVEVDDCRKHWASVVFYYNNYVDNSACALQNWSMACDMHLHIIGLAIVILSPTVRARNRALVVFFILSLVLPALEVYFRDLDGNFLIVAYAVRNFMMIVPTFIHMYKRTHTNMPCFVIGMYFGYLIYDWQKKPINEKTRKLYTYMYWTIFFWMLALVSVTFPVFLDDGPRAPMWARILFTMTQKPIWGLFIALIIAGLAVGIEETRLYSWILESPIWAPLSKLTYSMFATHVMLVRFVGGTRSTLTYISMMHTLQDYSGIVVLATTAGFFLYMLVEAPCGQLCKILLISGPKSVHVKRKSANENGTHTNGKTVHANGDSIANNGKVNGDIAKAVKSE